MTPIVFVCVCCRGDVFISSFGVARGLFMLHCSDGVVIVVGFVVWRPKASSRCAVCCDVCVR